MSNNNKINITAHISIGRVSKKLLDFSSRSSLYKRNKDKGTDFFSLSYTAEKIFQKLHTFAH